MQLVFEFAGKMIIIRIKEKDVAFSTSDTNFQQFVPIDLLKLDIKGILKEFPDLEDKTNKEIREEAINRFKEKIQNLGGEQEIKDYIVKELEGKGYVLKSVR